MRLFAVAAAVLSVVVLSMAALALKVEATIIIRRHAPSAQYATVLTVSHE